MEKYLTTSHPTYGMQSCIIKSRPDEFIVIEESSYPLLEFGDHSIFEMKKTNYTTEDAVQQIARALNIPRKAIGYAGAKDSNAITWQKISLRGVAPERAEHIHLKDISLKFLGYRNEPLHLGELDGNKFEIVIRNLANAPSRPERMVNLFGPQRFSVNNAEVGKAILKKDFKRATELVSIASSKDKRIVDAHLEKNLNDYVGALKQIPWKNLQLYIHAYQSKLWNHAAEEYAKKDHSDGTTLAIVGFSTYFLNEEEKKIYEKILEEEEVLMSDFVVRAIPDLTSEGGERKLYARITNLEIGALEEDELHHGMKKCLVKFRLGKGCYATTAIAEMTKHHR